ncbi:phosphonate C-P lyase system protein PhnH [Roseibacterium sp. SDUM158017]|uniref:phosphonate C-P lyase system protein PhnH n=1 Tax=Roseicyclus salinarum TaxID=3036773 RepID=UPI00241528CE|nr:phosphonate C-P lyase system protein PhnH [Roseibacterium sp. SDUM158017]MDG4650153.1 phosphonate C-P lyase system protein PhnH [Roseibacterium sp. SDUM158017]
MSASHLDGGFADPPRHAAHAFRGALQALSRPGRIERLDGAAPPAPCSPAAGALLLTLCDTTTPLHLAPSHDSEDLRGWIAFHTGAPLVPAEAASFALGTWEALAPVSRFAFGTAEYPDRAATLIVEVARLEAAGARLTGPGIETSAALSLPEIGAFRENRARFPLGFDCFFTCADRVAGLPRSTRVEEG